MSQVQPLKLTKSRPNTFKPVLVPRPDEKKETYLAAFELVQLIERHLIEGTQHYRTKSGFLLRTLDQVVNAILDDNLLLETESFTWQEGLARAA